MRQGLHAQERRSDRDDLKKLEKVDSNHKDDERHVSVSGVSRELLEA